MDKSRLNTFLFSEVGTETNGSMLTVLSVLARLGRDPWDQAARWAALPNATIVDRLAECIRQMPLSAQALADANETAQRLIQLLRESSSTLSAGTAFATSHMPPLPRWLPVFLTAAGLVLIISVLFSQANQTARATDAIAASHASASTE